MSNFDYLALMRLWLTISRLMLCKLPLNFEVFFWEKTLNCVNKSLINDKLVVYITSHYYHWFAPVGALIYFTQTVVYTILLYPTGHFYNWFACISNFGSKLLNLNGYFTQPVLYPTDHRMYLSLHYNNMSYGNQSIRIMMWMVDECSQ